MPIISSEKDQVRLLISDTGGSDNESFLFSDDEINTFLALRETINTAAALALRTIAGNEAQVSKRITFLDLKTDGPAVAKELRALATALEAAEDDDIDFDIAEMGVDGFSRQELLKRYRENL